MKPAHPISHLYHNPLKHRFDRDRFRALVQYVCWICDNPRTLGTHRLNCILWYSDRNVYLESGRSITGATYIRQHKGPQARPLQPMLVELEKEGVIARRTADRIGGSDFLFAIRRPNLNRFEPDEISIVEAVTRAICLEARDSIPYQIAHDRVWQVAQIGEVLPYFTVFAGHSGDILPADISWAMRELQPRDGVAPADRDDKPPELIETGAANNRRKEAVDAALWHLYRDPSIGISLPVTEASWFIYKQAGIIHLAIPDVIVVYTFDLNELSLAAIRLKGTGDDLDDED
jgi:hypothetical protein